MESGRAERQCVKNSRISPLVVALFIQEWQTIHLEARTLSPVKKRKVLHEPFYSSPKGKFINPFLPSHTFPPSPHCLSHQALPSSMKSTVDRPRSNWNFLGSIPEKIPVGGSSFIYSHHLPSGIPLESQNHKFQIKQPKSSL